jgi:hypothetical protein
MHDVDGGGDMSAGIASLAKVHLQYIVGHNPWITAALTGALIGIAGASLFIVTSYLFRAIEKERRSRRALATCLRSNEVQSPLVPEADTESSIGRFEPAKQRNH